MASAIAAARAEKVELHKEHASVLAAVEAAGAPDKAQRTRLVEIEQRLATLDADIDLLQRAREIALTAPQVETEPVAITPIRAVRGSLADRVLADPEFARWMRHGISRTSRLESPAVTIEGSILRPSMAVISGGSSTSAGAFIENDRTGIYDNALARRLRLRDLVTPGSTESDTVEFVRVTSATNSAAGVLEADNSADDDTTGLKPESAIAFEVVQPGVKTVAHWVPATNNALADARQLRTIIDQFLRNGIDAAIEDQMLGGNGTTELAGLAGTANVQSQAWDTDALTTTRRALGKVEYGGSAGATGNEATAFLLNPLDWVEIDLALTLAGNGTNNRQAGTATVPSLWGLPVVTSKAVTAGTGWVGDWRQAILWDREQTIIRVGQPGKFFLKNLNAVLAEARLAFGIVRPDAFCSIDLDAS